VSMSRTPMSSRDARQDRVHELVQRAARAGRHHARALGRGPGVPGPPGHRRTNVYWGSFVGATNSVVFCPISGCTGGPTTLATQSAYSIAVDTANVYWAGYSDLVRCAVGGCGPRGWSQCFEPGLGHDGHLLHLGQQRHGVAAREIAALARGAVTSPACRSAPTRRRRSRWRWRRWRGRSR
jgi:hypothetical protein